MSGQQNPHDEHRTAAASEVDSVLLAVVTVSDTRSPENDRSGALLKDGASNAGHRVVEYRLVPDEPEQICRILEALLEGPAELIVFNGGTGISRRDRTFDVVSRQLDSVISGFGELFRMLSYREVGPAAMLSRAIAGTCRGKLVFCLPGSPNAVRLAWEELIEPELRHLVRELRR